jgi:hypothetical protein
MPLYSLKDTATFPASSSSRYYLPYGFTSTAVTTSPTVATISYVPYYIKKTAVNPTICIEKTADPSGISVDSVNVGIYSGDDGLINASLLISDNIQPTVGGSGSALGIFSKQLNITLKRGFYIVAGVKASGSAAVSYRYCSYGGLSRECFGLADTSTTFNADLYYTQTSSSSLPSTPGTITLSATFTGVNCFLKY